MYQFKRAWNCKHTHAYFSKKKKSKKNSRLKERQKKAERQRPDPKAATEGMRARATTRRGRESREGPP